MSIEYSYIYLLVLETRNIFKVGKADNIINRYDSLKGKWGSFNLDKSYEIKCKKKNVLKLEKVLHYIFKDFNVEQNTKYDGYTEWFDMKCFEQIIIMLEDFKNINKDIVHIKEGIDLPKRKTNNKFLNLSKTQRRQIVENNKINKQLKNTKDNLKNANNIIAIFSDLIDNIVFFNKGQNLLILKNIDSNNINLLLNYKGFSWNYGSFNFIESYMVLEDLVHINLKFDCFEQENRLNCKELKDPYKVINTFFIDLDSSKIESSLDIGLAYKKKELDFINKIKIF